MDGSLIFQKILQLDPSLQPDTWRNPDGLITQTPEPCFFGFFFGFIQLYTSWTIVATGYAKTKLYNIGLLALKKIRSSSRLGCDIFFTPTPKKTQKNNELLEAEAN